LSPSGYQVRPQPYTLNDTNTFSKQNWTELILMERFWWSSNLKEYLRSFLTSMVPNLDLLI
jgi:hypothetical protein